MNYNINYGPQFKALIPAKEYCGTPKLGEHGIRYINKCKDKIKQYNRDITEFVNQISNPDTTSYTRKYFSKKKAFVSHLIDYFNCKIDMVREYGFNSKMHAEDFTKEIEMSKYNKELENAFEEGIEIF